MATVWVKPHFLEKDGPLENGVFMNICSWGFPDMFIRGGNLCSWAMGIGWAEKGIVWSRKDEKNDNLVRECVNYRDIMNLF